MIMENPNAQPQTDEIVLTIADIRQAASDGAIAQADADSLVRWACERPHHEAKPTGSPVATEQAKGFNIVTVAYYFGAMLMISAFAWFLGNIWSVLGSGGVLVTTVVYFAIAVGIGRWLRSRGYVVGGGLLITVAVCLVPLITFTIEDLLRLWPAGDPGGYQNYYPMIHGSWIAMELATVAASAIALYFVRFGFLTAPLAFSLWFFSMDLAALILGRESLEWNTNAWISIGVGLFTIIVGFALENLLYKKSEPKSEDFAFWCYLFGLMAFWGGMTSMDSDSELGRAIYLVINIGLVGIAIYLKRSVFLVFGAIGVHVYLGHLAYRVFQDSFLFPFAVAALGLSLILVTVFAQSYLNRHSKAE